MQSAPTRNMEEGKFCMKKSGKVRGNGISKGAV